MLYLLFAGAIISGIFAAYAVDVRRYRSLRDPTYREALQFVRSDPTNRNQYNQTYTCFNFASDFVNNAVNQGYKCGYVIIEFPDDEHAVVAFNTSDNGLIFIEPQNDEQVTLTTGQPYLGRTVLRFAITWPVPSEFASTLVLSLVVFPSFMTSSLLAAVVLRRKYPSEREG